jgi:hypothetical protein
MNSARRLIRLLVPVALIAGSLLAAPTAQAASTLDQDVPDSGSSTTLRDNKTLAQTFTAGLTGALTSIDIALQESGSGGDETVGIYAVNGSGQPTGTAIASTVVPASAIAPTGTWSAGAALVNVAFTPAPSVVAGTQYAYTIAAPNANYAGSPPNSYVAYAAAAAYAGGDGWFCNPSSCTWSTLNFDLGFRTYVDTGGSPRDLTLWQKAYARASAAETCESGWHPSWMQWPNDGQGGFVCVKNTYAYHPDLPYVD